MLAKMKGKLGAANPWIVLLAASVLGAHVGAGFYAARDIEFPGPLFALNYAAQLTALGFWLEQDSRRYRVLRVWDMGFFLFVAWVIVVPYYLFKTRGLRRGLLIMCKWVGACFAAYLVALIVFI